MINIGSVFFGGLYYIKSVGEFFKIFNKKNFLGAVINIKNIEAAGNIIYFKA